ncbi:FecCD family ABC transporter permease [Macrococcus brunensis]|uniref:FecCD family ABC transporter permease n=1 Tax=Macrococcus brunensis TaxID=198483 RepID=UPI001EF055CE|nr:iron ABC transporter permease [Macrococcus brunensis]ULG74508.1 iron ABC transporter permease [Macrococcus brunensis]
MRNRISLGILLLCVPVLMYLSLSLGYTHVTFNEIYHYLQGKPHHVLETVRMPRMLTALIVGMLMAVSGLLVQSVTRNPFASPGILGINSGASLAVMLSVIFGLTSTTVAALIGALIVAGMIILATLLPKRPLSILEVTLFGASIAAFCAAITQGLLIINNQALDQMIFWMSGSVTQNKLAALKWVGPIIILGVALSIILARYLDIFIVGDDLVQGLGVNVTLLKVQIIIASSLLAAAAVTLAGPIGFIGLVAPHLSKMLFRVKHLKLIPVTALIGACLLLASDILSRYLLMPRDIPVGITTALIGVPVFTYLVIRRREVMK